MLDKIIFLHMVFLDCQLRVSSISLSGIFSLISMIKFFLVSLDSGPRYLFQIVYLVGSHLCDWIL